jgi:hypothetical protein
MRVLQFTSATEGVNAIVTAYSDQSISYATRTKRLCVTSSLHSFGVPIPHNFSKETS